MATDHDGDRQFAAEAEDVLTERGRESREQHIARLEAEADALRREQLADSDTYTVIDEDGDKLGGGSKTSDVLLPDETSPWPYGTLEYMDATWEYRAPKALASMFLGAAQRKKAPAMVKLNAIIGYLEHVLSPASFDSMMDRSQDHEDEFDSEHMARLVQLIAERTAPKNGPDGRAVSA